MRWRILYIAVCWLLTGSAVAEPLAPAGPDCVACHATETDVQQGPMATQAAERAFVQRAMGKAAPAFFQAACAGCHVSSCQDCHDAKAHAEGDLADAVCLRCHRGYFTGWEYAGGAPREDHTRYQRGPIANGEHYLKMTPDLHQKAGLGCVDCHQIHGEAGSRVKTCRECHAKISDTVPEHAIAAHLDKLECWACHAAWAAQEYGTVLVQATNTADPEAFATLPSWGDWRHSAALRRQGPPPLGLNERGLVSPIRPQFILLATDPDRHWENQLLAAEWKAFFPHTIRRGTVTCGGCHDQPRRFLLEPSEDRIYDLRRDGIALDSWWDQTGQTVTNGAFFNQERFTRMNRRTPEFVGQYLRQWQDLLKAGADSSRP